MATKRQTILKEISVIQSGKPAIQRVAIGPRYHLICAGIVPPAGKTAVQCIGKIRVLVNGRVQREYLNPTHLDNLNKMNGTTFAYVENGAGNESFFFIFFAEPWRKVPTTGDGFAWRSSGLSNFTVEFEIDPSNNGSVPTAINCTADVDDSILKDQKTGQDLPNQLVAVSKVQNDVLTLSGQKVTGLELELEDFYQAIHLQDPHINKVDFYVNDVLMHELRLTEANERMKKRGLTPIAGWFSIVFDQDDAVGSALPLAKGDKVKAIVWCDPVNGGDQTTDLPRDCDVTFEKYGPPV